MTIDNQKDYWDKVAQEKTFTHPLDLDLLSNYLTKNSSIVDYGCGYGRIIQQFFDAGYTHCTGFDTSKELIERGKKHQNLPLHVIQQPNDLPLENESTDAILLFAVLTCIPSNEGQKQLIQLLQSKLKKGGILYISDYYLQENSAEVKNYFHLNDDKENYGVFTLPEGATFRHHPKAWILELTREFEIVVEKEIEVMTMNGHIAKGFQMILKN